MTAQKANARFRKHMRRLARRMHQAEFGPMPPTKFDPTKFLVNGLYGKSFPS